MLTVSVLISCEEASSGSDTEAPETIIATMAKTGAGDIRAHYLAFTASTVDGSTSDYRLALRESTIETIPTSTEMNSNTAIVRSLSDTAINIYMSFHIDADLSTVSATTASYAAREAVILKPATTYTLYVMKEESTDVKTIGQFTTDRALMAATEGLPTGDFSYRQGESLFVSGFVDSEAKLISIFVDGKTVTDCMNSGAATTCLVPVMAPKVNNVLSSDLAVEYPNIRTVRITWSTVVNEITLQRQTQ